MATKSREILGKKVVCEDLTVGEVEELVIEPEEWKISHLDVELSKDAAELVLGAKKRAIRNLLAVSAIGRVNKTIELRVKKGQLHIYLKAPKISS